MGREWAKCEMRDAQVEAFPHTARERDRDRYRGRVRETVEATVKRVLLVYVDVVAGVVLVGQKLFLL